MKPSAQPLFANLPADEDEASISILQSLHMKPISHYVRVIAWYFSITPGEMKEKIVRGVEGLIQV